MMFLTAPFEVADLVRAQWLLGIFFSTNSMDAHGFFADMKNEQIDPFQAMRHS